MISQLSSMWPKQLGPVYERLGGGHVDPEDLPVPGDGELEKQQPSQPITSLHSTRIRQLREIAFAAISIVSLWIVLLTAWRATLHPVPRSIKYETHTLTCGNTTTEAKSRGCAFDLLSHNWVPPPCLDPLTESEYREYVSSPERKMGPYPYYLDVEGKEKISDEHTFALLANGPTLRDQHVFTTREEHLAHCGFLLRRTHRAAEGKVRLNDENAQFWHAEHCIGELGNPNRKPMDALNEGFYVGFSPCTVQVPV
ncbi:hypothetical protein BKA64DRAFT_667844 [Cadophora sp. MPI-SDFR-AT-0126]|nr:hypothetical protein BKA64DRAFT_667844 [Leotiomycetes sp. MPI-SDFR-AT-0126]